jgi:hypothetical protein
VFPGPARGGGAGNTLRQANVVYRSNTQIE